MSPQLAAAVKLFPLLLPIWEQRPLCHEDLSPSCYPLRATTEAIVMQGEALELSSDRDLRAQAVRHLRETGTRQAFEVLVARLKNEHDPNVLGTILQQLCALPYHSDNLSNTLPTLLQHKTTLVRMYAITLDAGLQAPHLQALKRALLEDRDALVRQAAARALRSHSEQIAIGFFRQFWQDNDLRVRADALVACFWKPRAVACVSELAAAVQNAPVSVRYAVADNLHTAQGAIVRLLAPKLAKDPHAGVRGAAARAIGRTRHDTLLPNLLALTADSNSEVRRLTAENLVLFPDSRSRDALIALLGDHARLVRCQAEDGLVSMDNELTVAPAVAVRLDDSTPFVRFHVYRILGRIRAVEYQNRIFAQLENLETGPENIGANIFALGLFKARFTATDVSEYGNHSSPVVREEVARALGRLLVPATYGTIDGLIFDDDDDVREAAIVSAGWVGAGKCFSKSLLKTLKTFNSNKISARNRTASCWAAGRLRPVDEKLMDRLVTQGTTPVIPTPEGPMFEDDALLVSCAFALAQCARADATALPPAKRVLGLHTRKMTTHQVMYAGANTLVPSDEVREYGRQARAYLKQERIGQLPRPTRDLFYNYGRYNPPQQF